MNPSIQKKLLKTGEAKQRQFCAEALEARILYSAAPVEAAPEETAHVVTEAESTDNFAGIDEFIHSSGIESGQDVGTGELVTLTSLQNLTDGELAMIAEAAEQHWIKSGIDEDQLDALKSIEYSIVDLESNILGVADKYRIEIDINAAGEGWFIDTTPFENEEFGIQHSLTTLQATEGNAAYGIDLLSVLIHEQGHVLGLEDIYESVGKSNVMYGFFEEGERRLAIDSQADGAEALSLEGAHRAETPIAEDDANTTDEDTVLTVTATDYSNYEDTITDDNPIAYYQLDDASDTQGIHDGTANNVTFVETSLLPGESLGGAGFNGSSSTVTVPYDAALNPAGSFSFEAWVQWDGGNGYQSVITSRDTSSGTEGYILYKDNSNNWSFWTGTGGAWDSLFNATDPAAAPVNGEPTHIVATFEAISESGGVFTGTKTLYVNGVAVASNTNALYKPNMGKDTHIGSGNSDGNNFYFNGKIDEIAIYDKAITAEEVAERYSGLIVNDAGNEPALIDPVSVTLTTGSVFREFVVENLIGQITGVDLSNYADETFISGESTSWVTNVYQPDYFEGGGPDPVLTFGLDSVQPLTHFVYWGYGGNANEAKTFNLEFSTDGGSTFSAPITVSSDDLAGNGQNTLFLGGAYEADTVKITITDNFGGNRVGLGEVKFIAKGDLEIIEVNGDDSAVGSPVILPSGAIVTVESDGSYSYDPNGVFDYLGEDEDATDSFTYTISDGYGNSDTATVTITITGENDAPVAADNTNYVFEAGGTNNETTQTGGDGTTQSGTSGSVFEAGKEIALTAPTTLIQGSLRNDAGNSTADHLAALVSDDFNYDPLDPTSELPNLFYSTGANPAEGMHSLGTDGDLIVGLAVNSPVTISASNEVVVDFYGRDRQKDRDNDFDVLFLSADGTVLGQVNGVAIPDTGTPHVRVSSAGVVADGSTIAEIRIIGHDSDSDPSEANAFTLMEVRAAEIKRHYDPDQSDQVSPHNGSVNVTHVSFDGTAFQPDNPGGEVSNGTSAGNGTKIDGAYGTLTIGADGTYTYLLDNSASDALAAGEVRTEVFTYTISDGTASDTATLTITVTGANDTPTLTEFSVAVDTTNEDTPVEITFSDLAFVGDEADVDGTVTGFVVTTVTSGILTINGSAFDPVTNNTITATSSAEWTPDADANGSAISTFTVVAVDDSGTQSDTAVQVTVDVNSVNDAPGFTILPSHTSNEDAGTQTVVNFASGIDKGAANESDQNLVFETLSNTNPGLFSSGPSISPDGTLTYTAAANAYGSATIEVRLKDDGGGDDTSSTKTFTITVDPVNDAPIAVDDTGSAGENEVKSFDVAANDTDVDSGATLIASNLGIVTVTSSNASIDGANFAGAFSIESGQIKFDPGTLFDSLAHDESATVMVQYTVEDEPGAKSRPATLTLTISGANDAPVAVNDSGSTGENEVKNYDLTANDIDADNGSTLSVASIGQVSVASSNSSIDGLNAASAVSIDGTGKISFDPGTLFDALSSNQSATVTLSYTIQDDQGATSEATLTITVTGADEATAPAVGVSSLFTTLDSLKLFGSNSRVTATVSDGNGGILDQGMFNPSSSNFLSDVGIFMDTYSGYQMTLRVSGIERDDILSIIASTEFGETIMPYLNFNGDVLEIVAAGLEGNRQIV